MSGFDLIKAQEEWHIQQSHRLNLNLDCETPWIFYNTSTISRAPLKEKIVGGHFKALFNFVLIFLIQYQAQ